MYNDTAGEGLLCHSGVQNDCNNKGQNDKVLWKAVLYLLL